MTGDHEPAVDPALGAIRDGDRSAFEAVFRAHACVVYRACWRAVGNTAEAEDLLSVVFLEAWRTRVRAFDVEGSFRPWLLGITGNVSRHRFRSQRRNRAALERFSRSDSEPVTSDVEDSAVERADASHVRQVVADALGRLSRDQRAVAELCLVENLTSVEAAALLGVSDSTVRSRLAQARARLQSLLRSGEQLDGWLTTGNPLIGCQDGIPAEVARKAHVR